MLTLMCRFFPGAPFSVQGERLLTQVSESDTPGPVDDLVPFDVDVVVVVVVGHSLVYACSRACCSAGTRRVVPLKDDALRDWRRHAVVRRGVD